MKKIFKYELGKNGSTVTHTDRFTEILHLGEQGKMGPQMWALIDEDARIKTIEIRCVGTGWPILFDEEDYEYIGSIIENSGLVWHYYMREIVAAEQVAAGPIVLSLLAKMAETDVEIACAA